MARSPACRFAPEPSALNKDLKPKILEWLGCITGVAGAFLLALNNEWSGWGFVVFLISNVFWITYGIITRTPGLITMQVVFTATSILGIYQWM